MTEANETEQSLRDELIATNAALDAMGELYKRTCVKRDEERKRADKAEARVKFLSDLRNNIATERDSAENKVDSLMTRVADMEDSCRRLRTVAAKHRETAVEALKGQKVLEDEVRRLMQALAPHEGRNFYECSGCKPGGDREPCDCSERNSSIGY